MTDDSHNNGRRATDSWFARITATIAIVSMIYAVAAWGIPLAGTPKRIDVIEATLPAVLYMSCLTFRDSHPNQLPAVCDQSIGRGR